MKLALTFLLLFVASFAFNQNFDIYVSDAGNFNNPPWQILKFDGNGENPIVFIDNNLNWPQDILFFEDSNFVLISNLGSGRITKHNATTGEFIADFATSISGPTRVKIGPDNLLYVLQWSGNGKVLRYALNGTFIDEFTSVGVPSSIGIDWDNNGNLYVSSYSGDLVRKFDASGLDLGVFIDSDLSGPTNIWFDSNGDLLVADYDGSAVTRFDTAGNYLSDFMLGLSKCEGVDFFPEGDILIGNGGTSSVKLFDSDGNYVEDFIASGSGNLLNPNAVVIRENPTISITETEGIRANIIYPTIGEEFFVNQEYLTEITSIDVYGISGRFVEKVEITNFPAWRADNYLEGIYMVAIKFSDGSVYSEKIIVKK